MSFWTLRPSETFPRFSGCRPRCLCETSVCNRVLLLFAWQQYTFLPMESSESDFLPRILGIKNIAISTHLANGPWEKSLNFIFPTKYVIPKSLKFSHWPSKWPTAISKTWPILVGVGSLGPPKVWSNTAHINFPQLHMGSLGL